MSLEVKKDGYDSDEEQTSARTFSGIISEPQLDFGAVLDVEAVEQPPDAGHVCLGRVILTSAENRG